MNKPAPTLADRVALMAATGGGVGYAPVAPGTFGSLWGPLLMYAWQLTGWPLPTSVLLGVVLFVIGVPICNRAAAVLHAKDPGCIVFDEIAAFPFVFAVVEVTWLSAAIGFAWFRLFDISKLWPGKRLEHLPGGIGVMADDTIAGIYAGIALWLTMWAIG